MRIVVDRQRCEGHGLCTQQASTIFDLDDDGELIHHFEDRDVPAEMQADAQAAVTVCPVNALHITT